MKIILIYVWICWGFFRSKLTESSWHCFEIVSCVPGARQGTCWGHMCDVDTQLSSFSKHWPFPMLLGERSTLFGGQARTRGMELPTPCRWSQQTSIQKLQLQPLCCLLPSSKFLARANATVDDSVTLELFPGLKTFQVTALGNSSDSFFAGNQDWNQQGEKVPCAVVWDSVQLHEPVPAVRQEQSTSTNEKSLLAFLSGQKILS